MSILVLQLFNDVREITLNNASIPLDLTCKFEDLLLTHFLLKTGLILEVMVVFSSAIF